MASFSFARRIRWTSRIPLHCNGGNDTSGSTIIVITDATAAPRTAATTTAIITSSAASSSICMNYSVIVDIPNNKEQCCDRVEQVMP